jgi:hypothetical protein
MRLTPLLLSAFMMCAGASQAASDAKQVPLACNLKAFTSDERADWRKLLDEVKRAASPSGELKDGYTFRINPTQVSIVEVARWIDLERKCCPFIDFEMNLRGANGALSLALKGREGVKQFIAEDFRPWFEAK